MQLINRLGQDVPRIFVSKKNPLHPLAVFVYRWRNDVVGHSLHFSGVRRKSALHPTATKSLRRNERRFGPKAMTPVAHSPNTNLAFPQFPIVRCNSRVAFAGRFAQSFHVQDFNIASTVSNKAGLPQRICGE